MILSTGKKVYANGDIFGLNLDGKLTEGYDTILYGALEDDGSNSFLATAERCEIADEMIRRWQAFKVRWSGVDE
jgi:hypothetical protein